MATIFSPIRGVPGQGDGGRLSLRVANQIQQAIIGGLYAPDERLPIEKELAEQLGVSRVVVREGLKRLETLGLIRVRPGRDGGAFVQRPSTQGINDALFSFLRMDGLEVANLHEMRRIFEPAIAGLAAERSTPLMIAEIERGIRREESAVRGKQSFVSGMAFHGLLAQMTGNPLLVLVAGLLTDITASAHIREMYAVDQSAEAQAELVHDHQAILGAMRSHNADEARKLMAQHITRVVALETVEQ